MTLTKLQFRPGINRETTAYANEGGWYDCNLIRFRNGKPETMGGWAKYSTSTFLGTARSLLPWTSLDGGLYVGMGTNLKYYVVYGSQFFDITPLRATAALGANPITTGAAGSGIITVTDVDHGCTLGDFVTLSGATTVDGILNTQINAEFQVLSIPTPDTYTVNTGGVATTGGVSGGGSVVEAKYQITIGLDTSVFGTGWGTGPYSRGGWGSGTSITVPGAQLRIWSQDNYGEDLIMSVHDGNIYYWDASSGTSTRAVALSSLAGANLVPTIAKQVIVSDRDRHVIALGCGTEAFPSVQDPMVVRFSSQESPTDWETRPDNSAGEIRLGSGSEIIAAIQTKQQIIIFTDVSVHAMQYIGPPYTFGIQEVSASVSIIGPNAMTSVGDSVMWMGKGEFYLFNGGVMAIPCDVKEYIFSRMNIDQSLKVTAGTNSTFGEVWWFYPSNTESAGVVNTENDSYVIYNYDQKIWYYGEMPRTVWIDRGALGFPLAASPDNYLYYQENGLNDGSQPEDSSALDAYIESSTVDIGEGDQFIFASRLIPDITFRNSTAASPYATFTIKARNFPGSGFVNTTDGQNVSHGSSSGPVVKTSTSTVEQFTDQIFIRLRGRAMSIRVESNQINTSWRLGDPRIDIRTDGRR